MEDEIDLQLRQLALEAQQHPAQSRQRNRALTKLIEVVGRCHRLARPYRADLQGLIYQDLYNEAYGKTLEYICQNIDNYYLEKPVMAWVNQILKWRFSEVVKRYMNETNRTPQTRNLNDLDNYPSPESELSEEAIMLRELIEEDPDNLFRSVSLRDSPDITWQDIALAKLDDETSKSISKRLGVPPTTIDSLFNRNLRNFSDYIRNKLQ
ncbi:MAG: sigma-70 family RNA polymerase sigma factor [Microcoleus sp. PH2017_10_PVI_O_A]|uniref:hypothetical protein n=1 Tax=unclassified Microcoleus TaxID=2642155 RepID=UPI001DB1DC29|nr:MULTISPECIES: hypothetical protein [unclassified Microcoleus]TAE84326.1 MAG: sigma-70 family RNA polymerase sigma factor [Oscillatoriales cyanobacterium]MCC3405498.1 sigma-70 family RNA polymerase sigma factor [Microcoleus sp. PH2017_10_PVI_O_A]MCC3461703.1 sigma-70 family RNA polymerase sigma factor [Microcoleus sp. PH2017_11_PCY_U_A]MCC3477600.1 sigma-70 family RNA polymerase sigma factor [Microcoleus sp. PH2017_12_PCY_D_A]MCC3529001.1 sigma-70 family RNA polymerase sigma factor [Microcol